jgi:hypothetical protein
MLNTALPLVVFLLVVESRLPSAASEIWVRFSELTNGATYRVSDAFTSGGLNCQIEPFQWSGGQWTSNGNARVQSGGTLRVGSEAPFLWLNNVNVRFDFGMATDIRLQYGAFGGNQNLRVNGAMTNFGSMRSVERITLGTVNISLNVTTNGRGELLLSGVITNFAVGGQEFAIDDVRISPYVGPKYRQVTLGPSDEVFLIFSYPGTDPSRLVLRFTGDLGLSSDWLVDARATIVSTGENWFKATTERPAGTERRFYSIEQAAPQQRP